MKPNDDSDDNTLDFDDTLLHDILITLPGTSSRRKLDALINNVKSFSQLYSSMAKAATEEAGGDGEEGEDAKMDQDEDVKA